MITIKNSSEQQKMRYEKLLGELERDGAVVCDAHHSMSRSYRNIMSCEFKADLEKYLAGSQAKLKTLGDIIEFYRDNPEKMMRYGIVLLENAMNPDEALYREALADREALKAAYAADFENYDVCIMTVHCGIFHVCGMPSLALRLGMGDDGLPRGIILYGANERKLYAAAMAIEKYCEPITPPELD